jgi:6-pyruvoyltetrahydropterin/6-carboxytetrahydropterin synthase
MASVTKRYSFPAATTNHAVPPWDCFITIHGRIDPMTGMVTDIRVLDRSVHASVAELFEREHLEQLLKSDAMAGATLVKTIWERLAGSMSGNPLEKVRLVCDRDLVFEYSG